MPPLQPSPHPDAVKMRPRRKFLSPELAIELNEAVVLLQGPKVGLVSENRHGNLDGAERQFPVLFKQIGDLR